MALSLHRGEEFTAAPTHQHVFVLRQVSPVPHFGVIYPLQTPYLYAYVCSCGLPMGEPEHG